MKIKWTKKFDEYWGYSYHYGIWHIDDYADGSGISLWLDWHTVAAYSKPFKTVAQAKAFVRRTMTKMEGGK